MLHRIIFCLQYFTVIFVICFAVIAPENYLALQDLFLLALPKTLFFVVCLFVCLLATLHKNFGMDFHEILGECWQ